MSLIRPKTKLKQMHWDKIENINETFWTDIEHSSMSDKLNEKGILTEVEKVFVAKTSTIKLKKDIETTGEKVAPKLKKISFIPRDLAQLFGINLHMFGNLSIGELVLKVLHCDNEILKNTSVLEFFANDSLTEVSDSILRDFTPYALNFAYPNKKPTKDARELDRADRIYLELCFNLRHYWKSRSRALLLIETYNKDYLDLLKKLLLIDEACKNVRKSESLRNVLGVIRSVGNFMNDTSKQALGFKLDTLQRLKFMKDDTNSMTFLHYIEKIIRSTFPEFGSFVDELGSLNFIQNISIEQLDSDCKEYQKVIKNVSSSMSTGNLSDPSLLHPKDKIISHVSGPLENAKIKNSLLQSHLTRTLSEFNGLMEYFGEDADDLTSRNNFFNKFASFINEFKKAHIENIQREEDQRTYEARKRMIEESRNTVRKAKAKKKGAELRSPKKANRVEKVDGEEPPLVDDLEEDEDEVDEDDDEESKDDDNSTAVIDSLLQRLKSSAAPNSLATDRKSKNRRSKALSFYSTMSFDELKEQSGAARPVRYNNEYESVNSLKTRMSTRKRNSETKDSKSDQIMMRAQAMLQQLRGDGEVGEAGEADEEEAEKGESGEAEIHRAPVNEEVIE